jgi:hypothetical protein
MYKIVNKIVGVNKFTIFAEFEHPSHIEDICFVPEKGYYFLSNQCVGHINMDKKMQFPVIGKEGISGYKRGFYKQVVFDNPTSLCYNKDEKTLMVVEKNGQRICCLNLLDEYYVLDFILPNITDIINPLFAKLNMANKSKGTKITYANDCVCWSSELIHTIFRLDYKESLTVYGSGRKWFSMSEYPEVNSFNNPKGLCLINKKLIAVDSGNYCIRNLNGKDNSIIYGHPLKKENAENIGKILFIKNLLYYINNNTVCGLTLNKGNTFSVYQTENEVISFTDGQNNSISILEKVE